MFNWYAQVPFAEAIKKGVPDIYVGAVGIITNGKQAEAVLQEGKADVVFLARELLRHVDFPITVRLIKFFVPPNLPRSLMDAFCAWQAAMELGVVVKPTNQYERAWSRMLPHHRS